MALEEPPEIGEYRILRRLGEGAAGSVYAATPKVLKSFARPGDIVAVKVYKEGILREPNQIQRIRREFDVGSQIVHPRVVRIFDFALPPENPTPFLVLEYIDGITLDSWLRMFHPASHRLVLALATQILEGINALHDHGIIHRDIKPANIMVSASFEAKVMDLGVVYARDDGSITPDDQPLGTTRNSAPELLFGENWDQRADLYSLGSVLYALLHGREIFSLETHPKRLVELVRGGSPAFDEQAVRQTELGASLLDLTKELLNKKPAERPTTAVEVGERLQALAADAPTAEPVGPLHGYIATALSNLDADVKEGIDFVASKITEVAKVYGVYVYQPRRFTDPVLHKNIEPSVVHLLDRKRVINADLLIVLANRPSFGVGQELEIAATYGKPTILVARVGTEISRMVRGSFANLLGEIHYETPEDLEFKLQETLRTKIELIREWRSNFPRVAQTWVAPRIRALRESAGWTSADEFAQSAGIPVAAYRALEQGDLENIGIEFLEFITRNLNSSITDVLYDRPSTPVVPAPSDPNIKRLNDFARDMEISVRDYLDLRDEHETQRAASGEGPNIDKLQWRKRLQALQDRKFREGGGRGEPPRDQQTLL